MSDKHGDHHNVPLHCRIQQVTTRLSRMKHDALKSAIALGVWINKRNFNEIQQEAYQLQEILQTELHNTIENLNTIKAESGNLHRQLLEQKGKNQKLNEEIAVLKKEVAALSFDDMDCSGSVTYVPSIKNDKSINIKEQESKESLQVKEHDAKEQQEKEQEPKMKQTNT